MSMIYGTWVISLEHGGEIIAEVLRVFLAILLGSLFYGYYHGRDRPDHTPGGSVNIRQVTRQQKATACAEVTGEVIYFAAGAIDCGIHGILGEDSLDPSFSLVLAFSAGVGPFSRYCRGLLVWFKQLLITSFFGGVSAPGRLGLPPNPVRCAELLLHWDFACGALAALGLLRSPLWPIAWSWCLRRRCSGV
ncbi:hypothetical protein C8J57DRAFT_1234455 [Mycena rebaudengoi]|nr:hypothetical protein C8J57DRAFT_1234455 [Mycena rebaudengoi]